MNKQLNVRAIVTACNTAWDSGMSLMEALGGKRIKNARLQLEVAEGMAKHATAKAQRKEGDDRTIVAYKTDNGNVTFGVEMDVTKTVNDKKSGKKIEVTETVRKSYKESKIANALRDWFNRNVAEGRVTEKPELNGVMKAIMTEAREIAKLSRKLPVSKRGEFRDAIQAVIERFEKAVPAEKKSNVVQLRKAA